MRKILYFYRTHYMKTITVPDWVPTSRDFQRYKQKFIKWVHPPRCVDCNMIVTTDEFHWTQHRTGTHPLGHKNTISMFAIKATRCSCVRCMKVYLHQRPKHVGNCTLCDARDVPVMGYTVVKEHTLFITFLWHWWNSSSFCMNCIDDLLDNGREVAPFLNTP